MTIGLLGCFYDCASTLPAVLAPWRSFKAHAEERKHSLAAAAINCQFKEYAEMGYQNDDHETRAVLESHQDLFDTVIVSPMPLREDKARTIPLRYLVSKRVDLVWVLDGDEIYTERDIEAIVEFVMAHPEPDHYEIEMKNYIFDGRGWTGGFHPPRIYWAERHGGIAEFMWDNEIRYKDGTKQLEGTMITIPASVASIKHLTWQHKGGEKKVAYHQRHFGYCSFRFNVARQELEFDPAYFARWGDPLPQIFFD